MQIPAPPTNPPCTVDTDPSMCMLTVDPSADIVASPALEQEIVLVEDSDTGHEHDHDENQWVVSPPHPSEFVEPPPPCPVYYVVTIGEEAGIHDSTWAETFDICRVSQLEQFSFRVFHNWNQAHIYYTEQYKLNHIANAPGPGDSERTLSVAPAAARGNTLVANPRAGIARAQSAPPLMTSAVGQSINNNTVPIRLAPGYESLKDCGSPNRPIYVHSAWPMPAIPRPESPVALLPPAILAEPAWPVGSQPAVPNVPCCLLPTIIEEATRLPRSPLTQLHFDKYGTLIHPVANVLPPPVPAPHRLPQPFPLIPDPNFFTYPPAERRETPTTAALTPSRQHSVSVSTHSSKALEFPATPSLNTPTQLGHFVNLSPTNRDLTILKDRKSSRIHSDSESEGEEWACVLFTNGITPSSLSSARHNPVASSSKATKASKKQGSPTASTSKPSKICKTASSKKTQATSAPTEDSSNGPDSMYLPDLK